MTIIEENGEVDWEKVQESDARDNDKHLAICPRCDNAEVCYSHQWLCMKHQPEKVGYGIGCPEHAHEPDPEQELHDRANA